MIPATYPITLVDGARWAQTFTIAGITDATGYAATLTVRAGYGSDTALLDTLTSADGEITLSASAAGLAVTPAWSPTASAALRTAIVAAGVPVDEDGDRHTVAYSLSITPPAGAAYAQDYLRGPLVMLEAP